MTLNVLERRDANSLNFLTDFHNYVEMIYIYTSLFTIEMVAQII